MNAATRSDLSAQARALTGETVANGHRPQPLDFASAWLKLGRLQPEHRDYCVARSDAWFAAHADPTAFGIAHDIARGRGTRIRMSLVARDTKS